MRFISLISGTLFFLFCQSCNRANKAQGNINGMQNVDTTIAEVGCVDAFFKSGSSVGDSTQIMVTDRNGKKMSLAEFIQFETEGEERLEAFFLKGLFDLDGDGKKELVLNTYTGGAHCCDEFLFFEPIGLNMYRFAASTIAGDVCPEEGNTFKFYFFQNLGYFFTCYACAYNTAGYLPISERAFVRFRYENGKLLVIPGDEKLKDNLMSNLSVLKKQPFAPLGEYDMDDGLRKEYAFTLAAFYFSFGKNMHETQKLFNEYYTFPDSAKVWKEFRESLLAIDKDNSF